MQNNIQQLLKLRTIKFKGVFGIFCIAHFKFKLTFLNNFNLTFLCGISSLQWTLNQRGFIYMRENKCDQTYA
jgi:hypothetical protein